MSDVLSVALSWVRRNPRNSKDRIDFHIGGIATGNVHKHFAWTTPDIGTGDEIKVRLIDVDSWDEPEHVYDPALNHEATEPPSSPLDS